MKNYVFYIPLAESKIFEIVILFRSAPAGLFPQWLTYLEIVLEIIKAALKIKILARSCNIYYKKI